MKIHLGSRFLSPTHLSIVLYAKLADTQDQLIYRLLVTIVIAEGTRHSHARTLRHYRTRGVYIGGEMISQHSAAASQKQNEKKEPPKMTRRTTR
jgi:hypothetical protein